MLTRADKGGWGVIQMLTLSDRGGGGVKNGLKYADVILARSLKLGLKFELSLAKIKDVWRK